MLDFSSFTTPQRCAQITMNCGLSEFRTTNSDYQEIPLKDVIPIEGSWYGSESLQIWYFLISNQDMSIYI